MANKTKKKIDAPTIKKSKKTKSPTTKSRTTTKKTTVKKTTAKAVAPKKLKIKVVRKEVKSDLIPPENLLPEKAIIKNYLNNKDLVQEVIKCKEAGEMSDKLARMLKLLCSRYAKRGNYINYSYNDDMQSYAMLMLVKTWQSFNPERGQNAFAFYTQCIHHSFSQYLNKEKQHRNIRDKMLLENGLNPSFGFMDEGTDRHFIDDEEDYHSYSSHVIKKEQNESVDESPENNDNKSRV